MKTIIILIITALLAICPVWAQFSGGIKAAYSGLKQANEKFASFNLVTEQIKPLLAKCQ